METYNRPIQIKKLFNLLKKPQVLLFLILLLAFIFRFYRVGEVPPPLYPDEAMYAQDGLKTALTGEFRVYYPANNGREGLFMWILALFFKIFGPSLVVFKSVVGLFGVLAVLGIYLLGKETFSEKVGLFSAFLASFSFWPVHFSRIGFRADLTPFFVAFCLYFFVKGLNKGKIKDFIFGGIFLGLGFYTYLAFRLIVLAGFLFLVYLFWTRKDLVRKNFLGILAFLITTFIIALPIGFYFLKHPQDFIGRANQVSITQTPHPGYEFFKSFFLNFLSFFLFGDKNWRHNFSGWPILIFPISVFFALGLFYFFQKGILSLKNKKENPYFILFVFLFLSMMLPAAMAAEGNPHALRLIGAIVPVFIISGFGFFLIWDFVFKIKKEFLRRFFKFILITLLTFLPFFEFYRYFFIYSSKQEVYGEFSHSLFNIAQYFNSLGNDIEKYVICNFEGVREEGVPVSAQVIKFLTFGKSEVKYINKEDLENIDRFSFENKKVVFALMIKDDQILEKLKEKFPNGKIMVVDREPNKNSSFYAFEIEK